MPQQSKKIKLNEIGSNLIELCCALTLFQLVIAVGLPLLYLCFAHLWIHFQSQEALVCVAERQPVTFCERQLHGRVQQALPWGSFTAKLNVSSSTASTVVQFGFSKHIQFIVRRHLELSPGVRE